MAVIFIALKMQSFCKDHLVFAAILQVLNSSFLSHDVFFEPGSFFANPVKFCISNSVFYVYKLKTNLSCLF
jgi:hypothetical protein